jgi:galactoside O-acetyltransferase
MSFYSQKELQNMGFERLGENVKVSRLASFHAPHRISIGDHSRIDDFCVLSAGDEGISIGRHVHVAVMCTLIGKSRIVLDDFVGISGRTAAYSSTDDFSGDVMTGPTVPSQFTNVITRPVHLGRHVVIGAGCVILPGTDARVGAAVGALSLIKGTLEEFTIYGGVPAVPIKKRSRGLLQHEAAFLRGA